MTKQKPNRNAQKRVTIKSNINSVEQINDHNEMVHKHNKPVVKRGICKSEVIHTNGKTKPIRGANGHFIGCVTIDNGNTDCKNIPDNEVSTEYPRIKTLPLESPYTEHDYLKIYRVYNRNNSGSGYRFEISRARPDMSSEYEPVMTLYNPKTDIIALSRALNKYREDY